MTAMGRYGDLALRPRFHAAEFWPCTRLLSHRVSAATCQKAQAGLQLGRTPLLPLPRLLLPPPSCISPLPNMLKRQRPSSPVPIPSDPIVPVEPALDIYERATKRRRQLIPVKDRHQNNAIHGDGTDDEGEEAESTPADVERSEGRTMWQEEAGIYKAANTLLHDLHAEQRHRILFSSMPSPQASFLSNQQQQYAVHSHWSSNPSKCLSLSSQVQYVATTLNHGQNSQHANSHSVLEFSDGSTPPDEFEVQSVTQRYEDINKKLGSLFLSRRRKLDS
ncbi:hypothetical protein AcV7_000441 [Taiwanofungus camphoratus]|nr:hypothetical protein AcV7_000441 [Antrodia cinnamomea]